MHKPASVTNKGWHYGKKNKTKQKKTEGLILKPSPRCVCGVRCVTYICERSHSLQTVSDSDTQTQTLIHCTFTHPLSKGKTPLLFITSETLHSNGLS